LNADPQLRGALPSEPGRYRSPCKGRQAGAIPPLARCPVCAGLDVPCRLQAARRRAAVEPLLTFNEGAIMIDDPTPRIRMRAWKSCISLTVNCGSTSVSSSRATTTTARLERATSTSGVRQAAPVFSSPAPKIPFADAPRAHDRGRFRHWKYCCTICGRERWPAAEIAFFRPPPPRTNPQARI
jgi:hypothetical protein